MKDAELVKDNVSKRSNVIIYSSSSDDEFFMATQKKRKLSCHDSAAGSSSLKDIANSVFEVKESLHKLFKVSDQMHIPIAIRSTLNDTFKCVICQESPMKPPVIFAKCCKSILGCQSCVDTWYQGEEMQTRTCPKCRGDRAYVETCKLNGLDEFLEAISALRSNSN